MKLILPSFVGVSFITKTYEKTIFNSDKSLHLKMT